MVAILITTKNQLNLVIMTVTKAKIEKNLEKNKHAPIHKFLCVRALRRDFVQSWLNVEDKVRLVSWCSYSLYGFFQMELSEDKRLHHVLCGEQGQAEAMIAVNP